MIHDLFLVPRADSFRSLAQRLPYQSYYGANFFLTSVRSEHIVVPSLDTAATVARLAPWAKAKTRVLPNLVTPPGEVASDDPALVAVPDRYWLVVASSERRKNIPAFIEAWKAASRRSEEIPELVVVTSPGSIGAEQIAGAGGRLHLMHGLTDAQLRLMYEGTKRLWQPSLAEGFGLPVVEALSLGRPVAVASGTALDEVAPPDAPRFDPSDQSSMVDATLRTRGPDAEDPAAARNWAARYGEEPYRSVCVN